jgi:hypothetical protein
MGFGYLKRFFNTPKTPIDIDYLLIFKSGL